ncbi:MAG: bifunctional (p)ppGpp synthetase/guanosine-3',5'-bis(diphosphate) 3'-pyrophosphohydrolase [Proteobacteria bacterium]|nr:bifunctional (p)ppGpp synthetase/guanosine-3',5'-bis(diphosphate) 3'-pyrophosphohydrolase [Pseudomonadota bacterium]MBU2228493.1 bifunctional (p)ppGpp synthetase/guanosine-3',5'-bis(diphosphate) 3'-pyrophosphohydrolase [Pseudomonadota bacterium]MBU2260881.1 bifunctional (p)ppGpp synthetase/guanosine-3',5'-bis(diphosphate) 3'-pyrophosphohydrolase [Pseudomonadota bacterium]
MIRINDILERAQSYLPPSELEMIEKAYIFSASVHQGQVRLSGEPYLSHPMEVCGILAQMKLDAATLVTGLLHDTVEDTLATLEQIEDAFGKEVAFLVEGLTKISKISLGSQEERQAENFRKMIMAMSTDIRILLVRLADRIHNMRTLEFQTPDRQVFISKETLELYAPLANRLGINWMKMEMEDLSFRYLDPETYNELARRVVKKKEKREKYTAEVNGIIRGELDRFGIPGEVEGRSKHFYSIHKKMKEQQIDFDEVYDLTAFRIILDSDKEKDCYEALSVVHALWKPVPGRFKDYIAMPKANHYQSLHTTLIGPYGERVEVQIRTRAMHEWAEEGIAAHWRYKEGRAISSGDQEQIKKLRDLLDVQQEIVNPREFMSNLKVALFPEEVYVFTPNGDVRSFPKGATPIDFAYSIHTDIGHQCIGAKVNRSIVPLKYQLKNGDTVEIITQAGHHPSKDWLKYVVTSRAISKIRNWVKTEERKRSVSLGRDLLEKEFKKHQLKFGQIAKSPAMAEVFAEYHIASLDDLMAVVGYGRVSPKQVVHHFLPDEEPPKEAAAAKDRKKGAKTEPVGVSLTGIDDIMVRFGRCCDPIPGDEITGYISRGRGITVHTADCAHVREMDSDRLVDVQWDIREKREYPVNMRILGNDKKGLLADISAAIFSLDVNITHAEINIAQDGQAVCDFVISVNDLSQFKKVIAAVKKVQGVVSVERLLRP